MLDDREEVGRGALGQLRRRRHAAARCGGAGAAELDLPRELSRKHGLQGLLPRLASPGGAGEGNAFARGFDLDPTPWTPRRSAQS